MQRAQDEKGLKVAKEAKEVIQECVSDFIGFVTSDAAERLEEDKRKTITADDILGSIRALGFDQYVPILEEFMRELQAYKSRQSKPSKRPRKSRYTPVSADATHNSPVNANKRRHVTESDNDQVMSTGDDEEYLEDELL